ncbi:MAG TPA: hypothetical protein VN729_11220 [Ktedonobacteraceae bacterium]|nr:hypothetical protein [Ktedonobacteraceae bacterium]
MRIRTRLHLLFDRSQLFTHRSSTLRVKYALLLLLMLLLTACGDAYAVPSDRGPIDSPTTQNQVHTPSLATTGTFQEFALPQNHSGLMHPAIDAQGRTWFGEMSRNYLGSFDPQSRTFWQSTPPNGKSGIMGIVAAPDDTIWFAEQYADYIGHFLPQSGRYHIYPLPTITTPDPTHPNQTLSMPSAPNDLALDQHGTLWFTELNANALGSLNTATGAIRQYPLTSAKNAPALNPYGITVDSHGTIWFSEASSSRLGKLDPTSGKISYFSPVGITSPLMELASDTRGRIWATTFATSLLLQFDPANSHFTTYSAPGANSGSGSLYGLLIASNGDVWVAITAENSLARFDVQKQHFLSYIIPTPNSLPIGLVEDHHHAIWFTESGSDKIGMLQP